MSSEEKDFGTIVELLKKDYLSRTENNLKQKIGEITQDFIDRGFYNSTACTGKQLQAHFDHIDEIIDHILESLKQDFADIPLEQFKEKLLTIVDGEYKKLIPFANSHLVSAGLAQPSILKDFERQINNKKEKAKQTIEIRLAILEKQKAASKNKKEAKEKEGVLEAKPPEILQKILWVMRYGRKHWKLILLALFLWGIFVWPKLDFLNRFYHPTKKEALNDHGRTQLYARTKKRIDDIYENIEKEKLNPWIFFKTGKMPQITKHDGGIISYKGTSIEFTDAQGIVFWGDNFIPPFIEDAIVKVFDQTIEECRKNNLDPKPYINEADSLLSGFIWKVYNRMADIERRLRGKGYPKNIPRKDVSYEVEKMQRCLKEHYNAAILLASINENTD